MNIDKTLVTTLFELPGYSIVKNLDVTRGISVRSLRVGETFAASWQTMWGGRLPQYIELCESTREEAFVLLVKHAEELGANAIIGMRYDANEILPGITEVLAYGTAVIVEKK